MGLFDFFSKDSDGKAVEKWGKRLMNKYQQTAERKHAIEQLAKIGTEEAVVALLKRYQYRTEQSIADEDEKQHVYSVIVELGQKSVQGIKQYIGTETGLYWPIKALRAIVGDHEAATAVLDALAAVKDSFGQNRERRQQLVDNMRVFVSDDRVFTQLQAMLRDEDEEVVVRVIDGLSAREGSAEHVGSLASLAADPTTSVRLRMMILETAVDKSWNVGEHAAALSGLMPSQYVLTAEGNVARR
ncbi:MAG: hypothetical protein IV100_26820 [Myxococcales bacterium]|nr:hypothetical protein [Myxococcales bacterium]